MEIWEQKWTWKKAIARSAPPTTKARTDHGKKNLPPLPYFSLRRKICVHAYMHSSVAGSLPHEHESYVAIAKAGPIDRELAYPVHACGLYICKRGSS
jgi:hypothetical protein